MKIQFLSDTHLSHRELGKLKSCDLLIFGGDCMNSGYKLEELIDFLDWFSEQDSKYKILIGGNHDRWIENNPIIFRELLENYPDIIYLENTGIIIEGINIWGSPNSKIFYHWGFNNTEDELEEIFSRIPKDTNILITHAPALGIGDRTESGDFIGERTLLNRIEHLPNLKYHLNGHNHAGNDIYDIGRYININGSIVNEQYELENQPYIFEYEKEQVC